MNSLAKLDQITSPIVKTGENRIRSMVQLKPEVDDFVEAKLDEALKRWNQLPHPKNAKMPSKSRIIERLIQAHMNSESHREVQCPTCGVIHETRPVRK